MKVIETRFVWFACLLTFCSGLFFRRFFESLWDQKAPVDYALPAAVSLGLALGAYDFVRRRRRQLPS